MPRVLIFAALVLLATGIKARAEEQIPCWKAKAAIAYAGSEAEAEKLARRHGYSKAQIAEARKRCGI